MRSRRADRARAHVTDRVVISLPGSARGAAFAARPFAEAFRVHPAFDGRAGARHPAFDDDGFAERYGREPLGGERGAAVSHLQVIEGFAAATGGADDVLVVAEDDAVLSADLEPTLRRILRRPLGGGVVVLGELTLEPGHPFDGPAWWAASSLAVRLSWLARPVGPRRRPFSRRVGHCSGYAWGAGLYAMDRRGARRLAELARRRGGIDWVADDYAYWGPVAGIDVTVAAPALATFEGESTIVEGQVADMTPRGRADGRWTRLRDRAVILLRGGQATARDLRRARQRP